MNLDEISAVMGTQFWAEYSRRLDKLRTEKIRRYLKESITTQDQWIQHAQFRGEIKSIDDILLIPEEILREARGETRT